MAITGMVSLATPYPWHPSTCHPRCRLLHWVCFHPSGEGAVAITRMVSLATPYPWHLSVYHPHCRLLCRVFLHPSGSGYQESILQHHIVSSLILGSAGCCDSHVLFVEVTNPSGRRPATVDTLPAGFEPW